MNSQPDVLGARDRQEARGLVAVEADVAVGEVVDDEEAVLLGQRDDLLEERRLDDRGRRVVRVVEDQDLGPGKRLSQTRATLARNACGVADVERDDVARGQGDGVDVDREARARARGPCRPARAGPGTCG